MGCETTYGKKKIKKLIYIKPFHVDVCGSQITHRTCYKHYELECTVLLTYVKMSRIKFYTVYSIKKGGGCRKWIYSLSGS